MFRAVLWGAVVALLVVAAGVVLTATGVFSLTAADSSPERVLVIATAADEDGAEVATFAFALERGKGRAVLLDTTAPATVAGTTARSARDAYPFGGGSGAAQALAPQTGGDRLPWIVLSPSAWTSMVEQSGGVEVDLPAEISAYHDGELVVLQPGKQRLTARETEAVASSLDFIEPASARTKVWLGMSAGLSTLIPMKAELIPGFLAENTASSSLSKTEIEDFFGSR